MAWNPDNTPTDEVETVKTTVNLDVEDNRMLEEVCRLEGRSKNKQVPRIIRQFCQEYLRNNQHANNNQE